MQNAKSHIIIADSQFLIFQGLQQLLKHEFPSASCIQVVTKNALINALDHTEVALLIIDFHHIELDLLHEMKTLLLGKPDMGVLVLVNTLQKNELTGLNNLGITNILLKSAGQEEIQEGLRAALMGRKYFGQGVLDLFTGMHKEHSLSRIHNGLTQTEIEIVKYITEGYTTKQIAQAKHISHHTVMTHRKNIFKKLSVNNASELVMFAIRNNIVEVIDYQI